MFVEDCLHGSLGLDLSILVKKNTFEYDPAARLDQKDVSPLVKIAVEKGLSTRKVLKIGICSEYGGNPSSIELCHKFGLNYASCLPFKVPIARLTVVQVAKKNN